MKICLINNLFGKNKRGGAEKVVELVAKEFIQLGHHVEIISTHPHKIEVGAYDGVRVYYLPSQYFNLEKMSKYRRLFWHLYDLFDVFSLLRIRKIIKKNNYDLAITNNLMGLSFSLPLLLKAMKVKHIHILHDIQLLHPSGLLISGQEKKADTIFAKIYTAICRTLFASPAIVVSPSQWLLEEHKKKGFFPQSKKSVLKNPGLEIKNCFAKEKSGNQKFTFLFVGQIEEHKGALVLLEAFDILSRKNSNCRLIIVGNGSKINEIKTNLKNPEIKLIGRKSKDEVVEIMREADCLIVPSICYENSPTVIYEAFACGLPVIASKIGGIPELFANNPDFLFAPRDSKELADKMQWAINNHKEMLIAINNIRDEFKINNIKYADSLLRLL